MGQIWPSDPDDKTGDSPLRAIAAAFLLAIALVAIVIFCSAVSL